MALHQSHAAHSWEQVPSKGALCWSGLWPLPNDGCFNWVLSRPVLALMLFPPHMVHQGLNNQEATHCCLKKSLERDTGPPIPCLARATPALTSPQRVPLWSPGFKAATHSLLPWAQWDLEGLWRTSCHTFVCFTKQKHNSALPGEFII